MDILLINMLVICMDQTLLSEDCIVECHAHNGFSLCVPFQHLSGRLDVLLEALGDGRSFSLVHTLEPSRALRVHSFGITTGLALGIT